MYTGTLRPPQSNKKKIIIIAVIIAAVSLSALGGLVYILKGSSNEDTRDDFGRRRREWNDSNLPNPNKQKPQEIMAYMDSAEFKKVSPRERFMYMREGGEKVMEYQMETYFSLPDEQQKTAYLDSIIDRMQAQRASFEQMRQQMPPRRPPDANDPNRLARQERARQRQAGQNQTAGQSRSGRRAPNPSQMRARSERGTAELRAQRAAFRQAMQTRMQQRGITMPGPGGLGGRGGGRQ
jgi:hypothetical protein